MYSCHACKKELSLGRSVGRKDECPSCRADLHCCLNCRFYDRAASKECREPMAEMVKEKNKANFCDFFTYAETRDNPAKEAEKSRTALDALFKK